MRPVSGDNNILNPVGSSCLPCQEHHQREEERLAWWGQGKHGFRHVAARNHSNKPSRWTRERRYLLDCLVGLGPGHSSRTEVGEVPTEHNLD